jgi:hypothetical protein
MLTLTSSPTNNSTLAKLQSLVVAGLLQAVEATKVVSVVGLSDSNLHGYKRTDSCGAFLFSQPSLPAGKPNRTNILLPTGKETRGLEQTQPTNV